MEVAPGGTGGTCPPNNFAKLSYKGPLFSSSTWKIWTFMRDFLKKLDLNLKKCDPLRCHFLKKVDLYLKNLDLCAWFSEKNGAQPKNVDIYASISEKLGPQPVKMWTFTRHLMKKVDLYLRNLNLYFWLSKKSGRVLDALDVHWK